MYAVQLLGIEVSNYMLAMVFVTIRRNSDVLPQSRAFCSVFSVPFEIRFEHTLHDSFYCS